MELQKAEAQAVESEQRFVGVFLFSCNKLFLLKQLLSELHQSKQTELETLPS